jgi:hypothetical protein
MPCSEGEHESSSDPYPNNSITGRPVVKGREIPLLFCGA